MRGIHIFEAGALCIARMVCASESHPFFETSPSLNFLKFWGFDVSPPCKYCINIPEFFINQIVHNHPAFLRALLGRH
jgi:hypothetical protein